MTYAATLRPTVERWRGEPVALGVVAGLLAVVLATLWPSPDDASAHLYRTFLVRHGSVVWDNLWYSGDYPFASYSPLYYLPAAIVGNVPVVVTAIAVSVAMFASVVLGEWGRSATWPARAFVPLALGPLITGTYAYALGVMALFAALRALQRRRAALSIGLAAVTLAASPLAFVFLCLVLVAVVLARPRGTRLAAVMAGGVGALAVVELVVLRTFRTPGVYPFLIWNLVAVIAITVAGVMLARRLAERGRLLVMLFAVWGVACSVGYVLRSPLGDNLDRLRYTAFPLVLLTAIALRFQPRPLAAAALTIALAYASVPDVVTMISRQTTAPSRQAFWRPAIGYLHQRAGTRFRVEVVQTWGRWESYWLPRAGVALARGWYRQLDLATNPLLYASKISPTAYRAWLRARAVRYVLLPSIQLDTAGARVEAALLRSGRSGLVRVFATRQLQIYELRRAVPLLTGRSPADLSVFTHDRIAGSVSAAGSFELRVRFMPYWHRTEGAVCVVRAADGMTVLRATAPGPFTLTVPDEPTPLLEALVSGRGNASCEDD